MKHKIKYILFILVLIFTTVACSKESTDNYYKIGFVTDSENFENTRSGQISRVLNTIIENRDNVKLFERISSKSEDYISDVQTMINKECNLIIGNSFLLKEAFEILAPNNPNIEFLIFDSVVDTEIENIQTVSFKVNESSFLVGYLAGLETKTNRLGYVGFERGLVSDMYEYGFKSGVLQAAKELNKEIDIHVKRINTLSDFDRGKKLADEMYQNNIDIIYQTVGLSGVGVIESAKDNNKFVIGYDIDQSFMAPGNVLISSVKNYDMITASLVESYLDNKTNQSKNLFYGLTEGGVGVKRVLENPSYSNDNYQKMIEKQNKIINGEIVVPIDESTWESLDK